MNPENRAKRTPREFFADTARTILFTLLGLNPLGTTTVVLQDRTANVTNQSGVWKGRRFRRPSPETVVIPSGGGIVIGKEGLVSDLRGRKDEFPKALVMVGRKETYFLQDETAKFPFGTVTHETDE